MKKKLIIVTAIVALFTISIASTTKHPAPVQKSSSTSELSTKGLAMEDKDQFN